MQKRVELDDDTAAADWWKVFVLQLISHCFPPLVSTARKQSAAAAACDSKFRNVPERFACVCSCSGRAFGCVCASSTRMTALRRPLSSR
jgi:hypothetical protein